MKAAASNLCTNIIQKNQEKQILEAKGSNVLIGLLQMRGALHGLKQKEHFIHFMVV